MEAWFFRGMDVSSMRSMGILPMFFLFFSFLFFLFLFLFLFFFLFFFVIPAKAGIQFFRFFLAIGYWSFNGHWVFVPWSFFSSFGIQISLFSLLPTCLFPIA